MMGASDSCNQSEHLTISESRGPKLKLKFMEMHLMSVQYQKISFSIGI